MIPVIYMYKDLKKETVKKEFRRGKNIHYKYLLTHSIAGAMLWAQKNHKILATKFILTDQVFVSLCEFWN